MSDSDDDDLFAPKGKATMSGRQVKTAERFKPAKETSSEASLLANCDFLQKMIREEKARAKIARDNGLDPSIFNGAAATSDTDLLKNGCVEEAKTNDVAAASVVSMKDRAMELCNDDEDEEEKNMREGKTEKELFRPVPGICPAPLAMDASTHAFLQQDNDFPGSAALIQGLMSCPAAGCREAIDGEQDGIVGPGGADVVTDIDEMMLDQWLDAVLAATESFASVQFELLAPFFFRLAAFHPRMAIASKAVTLAGRSMRPGVTAPWSQGDFLDALVVYGFDKAELPQELARKCEAKCGARYSIGSQVQVKYEEGWFDGCITAITADGGYTVTVLEDGDEQTFACFPDPDVRPNLPLAHQDVDDDGFQANEALCRHLLCWLWLLQTVLRHSGGIAMTTEEAVGRDSWLDLMCALRVEPNVVHAPMAAYVASAPLAGMGTSTALALEEVARLLLLRQGGCVKPDKADDAEDDATQNVIASAMDCFCGSGIVRKPSARILLYQSMIPCSRLGEQLRRAVMTHELRLAFGSNHSRLFDSEKSEEDSDNTSFLWTGEKLLELARDISVSRSSKQILVCGQAVEYADFSRILLFILDCVDDVLPACKSSAPGRAVIRAFRKLVEEWLSNFSHKSMGISGSYAQIGVFTGLQSMSQTVDHIWRAIPDQLREPAPGGRQSSIIASFLARSKHGAEPESSRGKQIAEEKEKLARDDREEKNVSQGGDLAQGHVACNSPAKKRKLVAGLSQGDRSPLKALWNC